MSAFLASVRSVEEAQIVLEAGADIIDLKQPANGALGALPLAIIEGIVRFVDGRKPVSATVGDLPMRPEVLVRAVEATAATGVDMVKLGLFAVDEACIDALRPLMQRNVKLVAVLFADIASRFDRIDLLAHAGFYGVMLDTAHKRERSLCDCVSFEQLEAFLTQTRQVQLVSGLAGSLRADHIASLAALNPDYLGFRGALCNQNQRQNTLEMSKIRQVRQMLQKYHVNHAAEAVLTA